VRAVEEQTVEHGKVQVGAVEHEFNAQQHGQRTFAREESVDSGKEHHGRNHE